LLEMEARKNALSVARGVAAFGTVYKYTSSEQRIGREGTGAKSKATEMFRAVIYAGVTVEAARKQAVARTGLRCEVLSAVEVLHPETR
jgi:hypothetical protein